MSETNLYHPVKEFLQHLGFETKGEICGCDIVALDKGEPVAVITWNFRRIIGIGYRKAR